MILAMAHGPGPMGQGPWAKGPWAGTRARAAAQASAQPLHNPCTTPLHNPLTQAFPSALFR